MRTNVVAADNVQGGHVAANLFRERGYRRVAVLIRRSFERNID